MQAEFRFQRVVPVVESCVDYLAVATAGFGPCGAVPLNEERGCAISLCEFARDGETDCAGADDLGVGRLAGDAGLVDWTWAGTTDHVGEVGAECRRGGEFSSAAMA